MSSKIQLHQPQPEHVIRHILNNSLEAIELLEEKLSKKGFNFIRDYSISNYCFDFFDPILKIAIDIDGYAHEFSEVYNLDSFKKLHIHSLGILVFRVTDYQILTDVEEIVRALKFQIKNPSKPEYVF